MGPIPPGDAFNSRTDLGRETVADDFGRVSGDYREWRYVLAHHRARPNNSAIADAYARENRRAEPNPYIVANDHVALAPCMLTSVPSRKLTANAKRRGGHPVGAVLASKEYQHVGANGAVRADVQAG